MRKQTLWGMLVGIVFFFAMSMVWVNFHSALWYGMDMFTYSYEGRLMYEGKTCFPDHWIFGNQYHIISPPNIAALFQGLTHNSTTSMALASSLSIFLILVSFIWCFRKHIGKGGMAAGLLCLMGGTIFGYNAASYISGLQVLYTMCGYYACYLIGILLSLGIWLRLRERQKASWTMVIFVVLLNFSLGMQSLREMLILNIPLLLLEGFYIIADLKKKKGARQSILFNKSLWFVVAMFIAELAGHLFMKSLHVPTTPIIEDLHLDLAPSALLANFWASTKNLLRISGLAIASDGLKYLPLSICALIIALFVAASLFRIVRTKDDSPLAQSILFCAVSVLCVYGVGIFLMRTRDIYYFVYWLLAALSVAYSIEHSKEKSVPYLTALVLLVCAVNYGFTFIPNFKDYQENNKKLTAFTQSLVERGIKVIYVDASPVFAAASHDQIISQSFWLDVDLQSGYPLTVYPSDKHTVIFDDEHYKDALICFSNYYLNYLPSAPQAYQEALMPQLEFFDELVMGNRRFVLYKPVGRIIAPVSSHP